MEGFSLGNFTAAVVISFSSQLRICFGSFLVKGHKFALHSLLCANRSKSENGNSFVFEKIFFMHNVLCFFILVVFVLLYTIFAS